MSVPVESLSLKRDISAACFITHSNLCLDSQYVISISVKSKFYKSLGMLDFDTKLI